MHRILLSLFIITLSTSAYTQCEAGEVALTMVLQTDAWPYETYWELVPSGSGCGNNVIDWGSNATVGCNNTAGGDSEYPANTLVYEGPICLVDGESYDLIFRDSYGDGGLIFELIEDGNTAHLYTAQGYDTEWTFEVGNYAAVAHDSPCTALEVVPNGAVIELNNTGAIASFIEPHPDGGSCSALGYWCESGTTNTVWAYFVAEAGVTYEVTTCNSQGSFDTQLAVYTTDNCGDFSGYTLIGSNDDKIGGCSLTDVYASTCYVSCLDSGAVYYIQLDGWNGATGVAHLSISTYEGNVTLSGIVNDVACPLDKGEEGFGSVQPYLIGEGFNFTCEWTGPNGYTSSEPAVYDLTPGVYQLVLTSPCGVQFEEEYQIFQPTAWSVILNSQNPTCPESDNGNILLDVIGATPPYEYQWTAFNYSSSNQDIYNLSSGTYNITITDDNNCDYVATVSLFSDNDFTFDLGNDTLLCQNQNIVVTAPEGLIYTWQDGSTGATYEIIPSQWPVGNNALVLYAETQDGCSYTDAFLFEVSTCIAVEEINQVENAINFSVAPNPVQDQLTITAQQRMDSATLEIYDAQGKLVYAQTALNGYSHSSPINMAPGFYSICIKNNHTTSVVRVVKE
jgi:Secretion system C-terminal sorting domain